MYGPAYLLSGFESFVHLSSDHHSKYHLDHFFPVRVRSFIFYFRIYFSLLVSLLNGKEKTVNDLMIKILAKLSFCQSSYFFFFVGVSSHTLQQQ